MRTEELSEARDHACHTGDSACRAQAEGAAAQARAARTCSPQRTARCSPAGSCRAGGSGASSASASRRRWPPSCGRRSSAAKSTAAPSGTWPGPLALARSLSRASRLSLPGLGLSCHKPRLLQKSPHLASCPTRYPPDIRAEESEDSFPFSASLVQALGWKLEESKAPQLLRARR